VDKEHILDLSGNFRISGKTCFDIARTAGTASNGCLPLASRIDDLTNLTHTYSFVASSGSYTDLAWSYVDPNGIVASVVPAGTGNSPGPNTYAVTFSSNVYPRALGRDRSNPLKLTIVARYTSGSIPWQVALDIDIRDCSCNNCVVKRNATEYIVFMCYDLGAAEVVKTMTPQQQWEHRTPVDNYGDLYQWGRTTDGHEKRSSPCYGGLCGTQPNHMLSGANLDPTTGQPSASSGAVGHFIRHNTIPHDWRTPQSNTLWNSSGNDAAPVKSQNDPCPPGWRVPTYLEFAALANATNNPRTWRDGTGGTTAGWSIQPSGHTTPTLFLPAAGQREIGTGNLSGGGRYWSSSLWASNSSTFLEIFGGRFTWAEAYRSYGFSIRCVAE